MVEQCRCALLVSHDESTISPFRSLHNKSGINQQQQQQQRGHQKQQRRPTRPAGHKKDNRPPRGIMGRKQRTACSSTSPWRKTSGEGSSQDEGEGHGWMVDGDGKARGSTNSTGKGGGVTTIEMIAHQCGQDLIKPSAVSAPMDFLTSEAEYRKVWKVWWYYVHILTR